MTGRQLGIVALLLVLLLLVVGIMLGFAFGFFEGSGIPAAASPTVARALPGTSGEATQLPDGIGSHASKTPAVSGSVTAPPSATPVLATPSETSAVRTTPTITNTATITTTPRADVCSQISLRFLGATSNIVQWRLQNASGVDLELTRAQVEWPRSNEAMYYVFLDGTMIWSSEDLVSPTVIGGWLGTAADRMVNGVVRLDLYFGIDAAESGYNLGLWFGNGCQVSASN